MNCPICTKHTRHWSGFAWFAGTGWLIIVIGSLLSVYFGGGFGETRKSRTVATASRSRSLDAAVDEATDSVDAAIDQATDDIDDAVDNFADSVSGAVEDIMEGREPAAETPAPAEDEATATVSVRANRGSSVNPLIIVVGCLSSIALYVIPLIWMGCRQVAVQQITAETVTFKRVSTAFSQAAVRMQTSRSHQR